MRNCMDEFVNKVMCVKRRSNPWLRIAEQRNPVERHWPQKRPTTSDLLTYEGYQTHIVLKEKPALAVVGPDILRLEKNREDNVKKQKSANRALLFFL